MMCLRTGAPAVVAALSLLPMCGGRSASVTPGDGGMGVGDSGGDVAAADDPGYLGTTECGNYHPVGGGAVYVGAWRFDAQNQVFVPSAPCTPQHEGNKRLTVSDFVFMETPVTNLCYAQCVQRGGCSDPTHDIADPDPRPWTDAERFQQPVYVDFPSAQTLCTWLGGYLPSLAQLLRAAQGDAAIPGVAAMTQAAIACNAHPDPTSQMCGQIASMDLSNPKNGLYPVGQVLADVGPFGNKDLFGEGFGWTRTFANFSDPRFCALADSAPDYVTFEQNQFANVQFATLEEEALRNASVPGGAIMQPGNDDPSFVS